MVMFRSGFAVRRCWFLLLTLLAFALTLSTGGILWHRVEISSVVAIQTQVDAMKPLMSGMRLFMIALVAIAWPFVTGSLHRGGWINKAQAIRMTTLRWRSVTWLIVIELVLGQNLFGQVLAVLQGSRV